MKLLSPVGNFESLKMAVYNGADEVYLGISDYNARNNIDGFSLENLDDVVFFCHIFGVKVNLAVNILFRDSELENAVNVVVTAFNKGVDCFIIQDLGLASILHENYPEIELHASTQMGICNLAGAKYVEKLGFSRVVLARETPLEEIKSIKQNTNLEIEYFVQGALCVCFSGNCFLSSYLCDASGNRGKCKQLCRLPYEFLKNGKVLKSGYLLSAKDFNMSKKLSILKDAGVDVLKIEGRARRPFYVGEVTKQYALALQNKKPSEKQIELAFNREYTAGYFDGNGNIISKYNNHIGVFVGNVLKVKNGKKFNEFEFSSNMEISPKSVIKLFDKDKEENVVSLFDLKKVGKNTYKATTTQNVKVGNSVHLMVEAESEQKMLQTVKKADSKIEINAFSGNKLCVKTNIFGKEIKVFGEVLQTAKNMALSKEDVQNCFDKNEFFKAEINFKTDGVFVLKSSLNQTRREFFEKVKEQVLCAFSHNEKPFTLGKTKEPKVFEEFEIIEDKNQKTEKKNVIYSPETYDEADICAFKEKCEKEGKKMFLDLPNFALSKDVEFLQNIVQKNKIPVVCNNYYAVDFCTEKVAGGGLDVFNKVSANKLNMPVIASEDCFVKRTDFAFMTLRHCPMKCLLGASCASCPYENGFEYRMQNGKILKLKRKKLSTCTFYLT